MVRLSHINFHHITTLSFEEWVSKKRKLSDQGICEETDWSKTGEGKVSGAPLCPPPPESGGE